jgi:hypothetical protein
MQTAAKSQFERAVNEYAECDLICLPEGTVMSVSGQSRHFDRAPLTSGLTADSRDIRIDHAGLTGMISQPASRR